MSVDNSLPVLPSYSRVKISADGNDPTILIPALIRTSSIIGLAFVSGACALILGFTGNLLQGLLFGGVLLLFGLIGNCKRTTIIFHQDKMTITRKILSLKISQADFDANGISNLRLREEEFADKIGGPTRPISALHFDYQGQLYSIAKGDLDWDEAEAVLAALRQNLPTSAQSA